MALPVQILLLNLNITSPLILEQLVCHIIATEILFHLCGKKPVVFPKTKRNRLI